MLMHLLRQCLLLAALAALVPAAFAHVPSGTPKPWCEMPWDTTVHEYAPQPMIGGAYGLFEVRDGNTGDCNGDGIPLDFDGHREWAIGGARLLAQDPMATNCYGETAHHPPFGPITVIDDLFSPAMFVVAADTIDLTAINPCGDRIDDVSTLCFNSCLVTFPPGLDGAYHVYVLNDLYSNGPGNLQYYPSAVGHIFSP